MKTILLVSPYWKEPHRWMVSSVKLAELWQRMGYRVVVTCMGSASETEVVSPTLTMYRRRDWFLPDPLNFGISVGFSRFVRTILKEERPDIVVVNKVLFWTSFAMIPLWLRGYRFILLTDALVGMTWWPRSFLPKIIMGIGAWTMGWLVLLCAKKVVFFHPQPEKLLKKLGIAGKSQVVPTGIDTTAFQISHSILRDPSTPLRTGAPLRHGEPVEPRSGAPPVRGPEPLSSSLSLRAEGRAEWQDDTGITVTYVGRLESVKGVDDFLAAATSLKGEGMPVHIRVVGWYPEGHSLVQMYENDVEFLGLRDDIPSILAETDIFVLPSYSEGLSNALMEAMASGCACIATEVGGNRFLIQNGVSGFLFPPGDREALRAHIRRLIDDPAKRRMLGNAARKRIEEIFDWKVVGERYKRLFEEQ